MPSPKSLEFGKYYHIYNRGNNRENLFIEARNYRLFLELYAKYIVPVADTFAYALLRNHFHFIIRVKTVEEQLNTLLAKKTVDPSQPVCNQQEITSGKAALPKLLHPSRQFAHLFNAYARTFNNTYRRTGTLFQQPFGRIEITSDRYFRQLVIYIHRNPYKHGFVKDFREWPYSSFHTLLSRKKTLLHRDEVLAWFDNQQGFEFSHIDAQFDPGIEQWFPEDFD